MPVCSRIASRNTTMSDLMSLRFLSLRQPAVPTALDNPLQTLRLALRTHLTRQSLPDLSVRELADIGLTTQAALAEAPRLPWDTTPGPRRGTKRASSDTCSKPS